MLRMFVINTKNMKRLSIVIICLLFSHLASSQIDTLASFGWKSLCGKIISNEKSFSSSFVVNARFYMFDTITIDSIKYNLPTSFSVTNATNVIGIQKLPMDSVNFDVTVYNSSYNNLPFYPVDLSLYVYYSTTRTHENKIVLASKIYYTPYNTIEIWDLAEYNSLPRRWLNPSDNPNAQRKPIQQSSIPLSDITDWSLYEPSDENWNDWRIDNFREVEVDGLAYAVLMKPIPNDSISYYDALGDDFTRTRTNFSGTVSGYITASTSLNTQIGLEGLRVQLMEKDMLFGKAVYQHFGTTYTNENGYYEISYNENQIGEHGYVELYLKIFAKDDGTYKIVGNTSLFGTQYHLAEIPPQSPNAGTITFNFDFPSDTEYDAFRCVHWVRKGCLYFASQSNNFYSGIRIKTNCNIPASYSNNYLYLTKPVIHISTDDGRKENTPRHEFGHTAMYFLQNKNIGIPYGVNGVNVHGWDSENTSLLAWIEGWAHFVEMMLDAKYYLEDNEYGDRWTIDNNKDYENNKYNDDIECGFCSEYNIATALYDLWDGHNKSLPYFIPPANYFHGWNDSIKPNANTYNCWNTVDNVQLTLSEICAPLKSVTDTSKLKNLHCVQQYIDSLLPAITTYQGKRDVIRVFRENRVVWNIQDYNDNISIGNESTDKLFIAKNKHETGCFRQISLFPNTLNIPIPIVYTSWTDTYHVSSLNENATNNWDFCPNTSAEQLLIDDYLVGYFNPPYSRFTNMNLNTYNSNNVQTANFSTCGNDNLIKVRNGTLTLGSTDGTYKANLTISNGSLLEISTGAASLVVNDGSVLTISQGGTLCVKEKGTIIVRGNGRIVVEDGAYICIADGYNAVTVYLQTSNSIIDIAENAIIGVNPIHNVENCSCMYPCDIPLYNNSEGYINCACGFGIFDYNNDYIVSESETITGTKKFKQNIVVQSGKTLTLNNARFEMLDNKSIIIINAGGKLVVDNSTITNSSYCPDKMWKGIRVLGNKNQRQLAQYQGTLEIKNGSVISNAKDAISTWDGDDYNTTGGIVKCTNSTFLNNRRSAEFMAYINHTSTGSETSNVSYFKNCNFTIDDNNIFTAAGVIYSDIITMWGVNGVAIRGCHFSDVRTGSPTRGNAVSVASAGVTIKPSCNPMSDYSINMPCICVGESRNTFSGFTKALNAQNTGTNYPFKVFKADFENCSRPVHSSAVNNFNVTMSDINLTCAGGTVNKYGIYSLSCTGYKIEGNDFYTTNISSSSIKANGIRVSSSGNDANSIHKNTFENLDKGVWSDSNPELQVSCNDFSNNFGPDIYTSGNFPSQGSSSESAGNKFTTGASMNICSIESSFLYYHSGLATGTNQYKPTTSSNVTNVPNITANECDPTICLLPGTGTLPGVLGSPSAPSIDDISLYESLQQIYDSRYADYNAAGYGFLLENFNEEDADIVATARLMQDTLVSIRRAMAEIANRNIDAILQDTVVFDRKSLNGWYNRINTQTAKYSLVNSYFEVGEYALARQELAAIPQRFALTADEQSEYDNFCQYQSLRESVYSSGRNYAQLTEDEIAELQRIVERNTGVSSAYANSVLCFFYGICRDEEIDIGFDIDAPMNSKSTTEVVEENAEPLAIYVYPNPADEELNILLNSFPEGKTMIEFHDVTGRLVLSEEIKSANTSINISSLRQGVYMYRIINGENIIARDRVVKE